MTKYGGLNGTTTANQDLYQDAKTAKGWESYTPWRRAAFVPESDCTIKINGQTDVISVKADIGFSDDNTQITGFVVVEAGITYVLSYRY